jgi:serine phosphatase RsbU (regulator of sigma subunit)
VLFLFHQCDGPREWSEDDLSLAQRVVSQVAVAVENVHLYEQELKQAQFQRTMAEIATAVGSSVELTEVLRAVGEQGMRLLNADGAYIWRLEEASREMVSAAAVGHKADKFRNLRLALTRRSFHVVRAATERRPIVAHGIGSDRRTSQRLNRMFDCQSLLAVPLLLREKVIGVVQFSITGDGAGFDEDQVTQAGILVSQAAAAVENAQLYEAERGRAEELEVLWRIGQEIAENLQPERLFTSIVAGARRVLDVEAASLMMFEEDDETLSVAAAEGLSPEHVAAARFRRGERIPRCVAVDGAHRLTANLAEDSRYPPIAGQEGLQSMLSVPMPDGTQIAGALNVYSSRRRHFRVEEAQKLDLLASFAMAALRQARQFRREQKIAQAFQRDLLPELKLNLTGFEVAPKSIAALTAEADFGGDFYDVHPISETQIGLAIGDVSGKGLAAAPQRAMVKCVLRAFAFESPSPGPVLERLNRLLNRTMGAEQFVTLFYGVLDVKKGELTYANAGHELPLVLRRGSGSPELLETTGPLLAVDGGSQYRQICTPIATGDTLVLYTDGFTEARRGNDFLQVEGLASLLDEFREGSAGDMVESISRSVEDHYGSLRDDATILVVKSVGSG